MKIVQPEAGEDRHKYQQILRDLRKAIFTGVYPDGKRLPSEMQLAEQFATSRPPVARALKELQHEGLIERRAGSGSYVRRRSRREGLVFGLLIPGLGETEIFEPICQGMARAGRAGGHALLWGDTTHPAADSKENEAKQLCEYYLSRNVSGVFFAPLELTPSKDEVNQWIADALHHANIPVVLLDRCIYAYPNRSRYDLVGIDNRRAGYNVTEHLIKLGNRRIIFFGRPHSAPTVEARIAGFREAHSTSGMEMSPDFIQRGDPSDASLVEAIVKDLRPDAFVCANDHTAGHLMLTLDGLGYHVPDDIRIAGIDDVKYASLLRVPLTTLHQPCQDLGAAAILTMLERIAHPALPARDILLDCKLAVRRSCGTDRV